VAALEQDVNGNKGRKVQHSNVRNQLVTQIHPVDTKVRRYRAIFLSDVHLGTKGCQAELLLDFLRHNDADTIYLVGDIIDFWRIKRNPHWPQQHNDVVQKLLRKVRQRNPPDLYPRQP